MNANPSPTIDDWTLLHGRPTLSREQLVDSPFDVLYVIDSGPWIERWARDLPNELLRCVLRSEWCVSVMARTRVVGDVPSITTAEATDRWMFDHVPASDRFGVISVPRLTNQPATNRTTVRPALAPSTPRDRWRLDAIDACLALPAIAPMDHVRKTAFAAGLYQLHDWLDESHQQSQSIEGIGSPRAGDRWHAIMHRREPDYGNAHYWVRRMGPHPIDEALAAIVPVVAQEFEAPASIVRSISPNGRWSTAAFVDVCEQAESTRDASLIGFAQEVQFAELLLLIAACGRLE